MFADLTLPQKLWNKGVDILAGRDHQHNQCGQRRDCWEHYYKWLLVNGLDGLPGNLKIIVEHSAWGAGLRGTATH